MTYVAEARTAIRVAAADRANFLLQALGMAINNGFVLAMWFLFFGGFRSVGGWTMPDVALLIGLLATTVGLAGVICGGYRDLAAAILRGEPDGLLVQPRSVLPRLLARDSNLTGWGDIATGVILLAAFSRLSTHDAPWLVFVLLCGLTIFVATAVLFACLAFWAKGARSFARDLTDFIIMFSSWPGSIHTPTTKLIVYTVFPAGFIVLAPVALLRHPALSGALTIGAAAAGYAFIAIWAFEQGLRRYRDGAAPGV